MSPQQHSPEHGFTNEDILAVTTVLGRSRSGIARSHSGIAEVAYDDNDNAASVLAVKQPTLYDELGFSDDDQQRAEFDPYQLFLNSGGDPEDGRSRVTVDVLRRAVLSCIHESGVPAPRKRQERHRWNDAFAEFGRADALHYDAFWDLCSAVDMLGPHVEAPFAASMSAAGSPRPRSITPPANITESLSMVAALLLNTKTKHDGPPPEILDRLHWIERRHDRRQQRIRQFVTARMPPPYAERSTWPPQLAHLLQLDLPLLRRFTMRAVGRDTSATERWWRCVHAAADRLAALNEKPVDAVQHAAHTLRLTVTAPPEKVTVSDASTQTMEETSPAERAHQPCGQCAPRRAARPNALSRHMAPPSEDELVRGIFRRAVRWRPTRKESVMW
jgi:hypothetical protein